MDSVNKIIKELLENNALNIWKYGNNLVFLYR